jgi:hypothetical protein
MDNIFIAKYHHHRQNSKLFSARLSTPLPPLSPLDLFGDFAGAIEGQNGRALLGYVAVHTDTVHLFVGSLANITREVMNHTVIMIQEREMHNIETIRSITTMDETTNITYSSTYALCAPIIVGGYPISRPV